MKLVLGRATSVTRDNQMYSSNSHHLLLSPERTIFIVVDHQMVFASCFDRKAIIAVENGVEEILVSAEELGVPIIASLVETELTNPKFSELLEKSIPQISRFNRNCVNPWDDQEFVGALQKHDRQCILIAGLFAESTMSYTAVCALENGFDVYVVRDTCLGYSDQSIATACDRLTQFGAVSVSWRQVILEWSQGAADVNLLGRFLKFRKGSKS